MTVAEFSAHLAGQRLIASVQASEGSPVEHPETLARLARASVQEGVRVLRLQGVENIRAVRAATPGTPCIGLIKRTYPGSDVYITPTQAEIDQLVESQVEIIALDGTARPRPGGVSLAALIARIHAAGRLAMADCDSLASAQAAQAAGADLIGTTLSGYTPESPKLAGPDLALLRELVDLAPGRVIAEGRFSEPWHVTAALRLGATAVVMGGALNDPIKLTRHFGRFATIGSKSVGAVDLGGTWLRWGTFDATGTLIRRERIPLPGTHAERLDWLRQLAREDDVERIGISAGGVVDPATATIADAKGFIPNYVGRSFAGLPVPVLAVNDGLATAWGHALHPEFVGQRVATLALGTGVGMGIAGPDDVWTDARGDYPRLNDLVTANGQTFEERLGGLALGPNPTSEQQANAVSVAREALAVVRQLYHPDVIVIAGGVGLAPWLLPALDQMPNVVPTPFGPDAGLHGAAALALWPPQCLRGRAT